jgi:type I restriction enzyme, S subunit
MSWPVHSLKDVCNIDMGSAPKGTSYVELAKGVPLIAGAADYGDITPNPKKSTTEPTRLTQKGDIIICVRATIGDLNWADKQYCLGRGVAGLRADEQLLDSKYLWYFIKSYEQELYRQATGSTFPQINRTVIESIQVPLPPLSTQKKIAEILEKADQLRKDCQQMDQELNNLAQAVFIDMFGEIEEVDKLDSHIEFLTSGSRGWAQYYASSGARFIRSLDVQMNFIGNDDIAYVKPPSGQEAIRTKVQKGDVLLTITGSRIGRVSPVSKGFGDAHISQHVALIRLKKSMLPEFLSYYLSMPSFGQRQIEKSQYGQTKPGLKLDHIREFTVPNIDVKKQREFVSFMESIEDVKNNNYLKQSEVEVNFASLMQKAFSGELNLKHKAA